VRLRRYGFNAHAIGQYDNWIMPCLLVYISSACCLGWCKSSVLSRPSHPPTHPISPCQASYIDRRTTRPRSVRTFQPEDPAVS